MALPNKNQTSIPNKRIRLLYSLLSIAIGIFIIQLFYVQIIKYGHYKAAALSDQLKEYTIQPSRGEIDGHDSNAIVPLVLNQTLYTLYADPIYIKNPTLAGDQIANIIGGESKKYSDLMKTKNTQYVILAKKLTQPQSNKILALKNPGVGTQAQNYRVYPDGSLASQILGFVNDNGHGNYGIEQALNTQLTGKTGLLKAITDANGIPLAASNNNIQKSPKNGDKVVTTLDLSMQAQLEQILSSEYQKTKSKGISAIIMDPNSGSIKAMANYPSYDPSNFQKVTDQALYQNAAVTNAIEPGSSMKVLTTAAALDLGIIHPDTSFYDPAHWIVDGFNITDIEQDGGPRNQTIQSLLNLSLNTGATWLLMQMGGGQINQKARNTWYDYMTNHYQLGKITNVEQGYESASLVPTPQDNGAGIDLTYANTSFGQAIQITALQMAAADSAVLNGGTYYQPTLIDQLINSDGKVSTNHPKIIKKHVVSPQVSQDMTSLMEYVVQQHLQAGFSYLNFSPNYIVGGKTGTAQIAQPKGGYYPDKFNGTYVGFVGGDKPQYVVVVYNIQPTVAGYAGSFGGQPVFGDIAHMLINNSFVDQKTQ